MSQRSSLASRSRKKRDVISSKRKQNETTNDQVKQTKIPTSSPLALSDDKISDSDLIVISEAESEKVSPHNDYSGISPCYISNLNCHDHDPKLFNAKVEIQDQLRKLQLSSSADLDSPMLNTGFVTVSKEKRLNPKTNKVVYYSSPFSPQYTLSDIEISSNTDLNHVDTETVNVDLENSKPSTSSNFFDKASLISKSDHLTSKSNNALHIDPSKSCFSPKQAFMFFFNNLNLNSDYKENLICNQLKARPLVKPIDFNYDQNNAFKIAANLSEWKAANDYLKERDSQAKTFPVTLTSPGATLKIAWQNSLEKSSNLSLNSVDLGVSSSEDAESGISFCSYKTVDIQPDFFDMTFTESAENVPEEFSENSVSIPSENPDFLSTEIFCSVGGVDSDLRIAANEICTSVSQNPLLESTDSPNNVIELDSAKVSPKTKKRKRKRRIWGTRKRKRCKKNNSLPKLNSTLKEILCDTCDESETEEPAPGSYSAICLTKTKSQDDKETLYLQNSVHLSKRNENQINNSREENNNDVNLHAQDYNNRPKRKRLENNQNSESINDLVTLNDLSNDSNTNNAVDGNVSNKRIQAKSKDDYNSYSQSSCDSTMHLKNLNLDNPSTEVWATVQEKSQKKSHANSDKNNKHGSEIVDKTCLCSLTDSTSNCNCQMRLSTIKFSPQKLLPESPEVSKCPTSNTVLSFSLSSDSQKNENSLKSLSQPAHVENNLKVTSRCQNMDSKVSELSLIVDKNILSSQKNDEGKNLKEKFDDINNSQNDVSISALNTSHKISNLAVSKGKSKKNCLSVQPKDNSLCVSTSDTVPQDPDSVNTKEVPDTELLLSNLKKNTSKRSRVKNPKTATDNTSIEENISEVTSTVITDNSQPVLGLDANISAEKTCSKTSNLTMNKGKSEKISQTVQTKDDNLCVSISNIVSEDSDSVNKKEVPDAQYASSKLKNTSRQSRVKKQKTASENFSNEENVSKVTYTAILDNSQPDVNVSADIPSIGILQNACNKISNHAINKVKSKNISQNVQPKGNSSSLSISDIVLQDSDIVLQDSDIVNSKEVPDKESPLSNSKNTSKKSRGKKQKTATDSTSIEENIIKVTSTIIQDNSQPDVNNSEKNTCSKISNLAMNKGKSKKIIHSVQPKDDRSCVSISNFVSKDSDSVNRKEVPDAQAQLSKLKNTSKKLRVIKQKTATDSTSNKGNVNKVTSTAIIDNSQADLRMSAENTNKISNLARNKIKSKIISESVQPKNNKSCVSICDIVPQDSDNVNTKIVSDTQSLLANLKDTSKKSRVKKTKTATDSMFSEENVTSAVITDNSKPVLVPDVNISVNRKEVPDAQSLSSKKNTSKKSRVKKQKTATDIASSEENISKVIYTVSTDNSQPVLEPNVNTSAENTCSKISNLAMSKGKSERIIQTVQKKGDTAYVSISNIVSQDSDCVNKKEVPDTESQSFKLKNASRKSKVKKQETAIDSTSSEENIIKTIHEVASRIIEPDSKNTTEIDSQSSKSPASKHDSKKPVSADVSEALNKKYTSCSKLRSTGKKNNRKIISATKECNVSTKSSNSDVLFESLLAEEVISSVINQTTKARSFVNNQTMENQVLSVSPILDSESEKSKNRPNSFERKDNVGSSLVIRIKNKVCSLVGETGGQESSISKTRPSLKKTLSKKKRKTLPSKPIVEKTSELTSVTESDIHIENRTSFSQDCLKYPESFTENTKSKINHITAENNSIVKEAFVENKAEFETDEIAVSPSELLRNTELIITQNNGEDDVNETSSKPPVNKNFLDIEQNCPNQINERNYSKNLDFTGDDNLNYNTDDNLNLGLDEDLDFEPDQPFDMKNVGFVNSFDLREKNLNTELHESNTYLNKKCKSNDIADNDFDEENPYNYPFTINNFKAHPSNDGLYSEDDSESEDEHSFKRSRSERKKKLTKEPPVNHFDVNNSEDRQENKFGQIQTSQNSDSCLQKSDEIRNLAVAANTSKNELNISKDKSNVSSSEDQNSSHLKKEKASLDGFHSKVLTIPQVCARIKELCEKKLLTEAVEVAQTYIAISCSNDANKSIFRTLLSSLFFVIFNINCDNIFISKIFDDVLVLMQNFHLCDKKISSYFITKCSSHPYLSKYSVKLFHICRTNHIPLNTKAINEFGSLLKSAEVSLPVLLDFLMSVKTVCNKKVSKDLTHLALEKSMKSKFADLHNMCSFLYHITPKEVDDLILECFLQLCFKKGMWPYVAEMFSTWGMKNRLTTCIHKALVAEYETMGNFFSKFADAVHGSEQSLNKELELIFGQIGTCLMLNAFSKSHLQIGLEVLYTLHKYNVNYFETQLFLSKSCQDAKVNIFPFSVVFAAIDICLNLKRPKDAFTIFQGFSWITLDDSVNEADRAYLFSEKYHRLMQLIPLLNNEDSLNEGSKTLNILLSEDSFQQKLEENKKEICSTYNDYLISLLNSGTVASVFDLYQHSLGPKKHMLVISPDVLRGLVAAFSQHGMTETANTVFMLGIMTKVYSIKKPEPDNFPWEITIMNNWTVPEIKLAMEWFIGTLFPLLTDKPKETNFEKWFSVKILFEVSESCSNIHCLSESDSNPKDYIKKTKEALQTMNPCLELKEEADKSACYIKSDSLYSYWKSRCPDVSLNPSCDTKILRSRRKGIFSNELEASAEEETSFSLQLNDKDSNKYKNLQSQSPLEKFGASTESYVSKMIVNIRANTSQHSNSSNSHIPNSIETNSHGCLLTNITQINPSKTILNANIDKLHRSPKKNDAGNYINPKSLASLCFNQSPKSKSQNSSPVMSQNISNISEAACFIESDTKKEKNIERKATDISIVTETPQCSNFMSNNIPQKNIARKSLRGSKVATKSKGTPKKLDLFALSPRSLKANIKKKNITMVDRSINKNIEKFPNLKVQFSSEASGRKVSNTFQAPQVSKTPQMVVIINENSQNKPEKNNVKTCAIEPVPEMESKISKVTVPTASASGLVVVDIHKNTKIVQPKKPVIKRTCFDIPDKKKTVDKTVSVNFLNEDQKSVQDEGSIIQRISVRIKPVPEMKSKIAKSKVTMPTASASGLVAVDSHKNTKIVQPKKPVIRRTFPDIPGKIKAIDKTFSVNFQNEDQKSVQDERSVPTPDLCQQQICANSSPKEDRILRTSSDSPDKIKAVGKTVSVNFQNEEQKSVQDERSVNKEISVRFELVPEMESKIAKSKVSRPTVSASGLVVVDSHKNTKIVQPKKPVIRRTFPDIPGKIKAIDKTFSVNFQNEDQKSVQDKRSVPTADLCQQQICANSSAKEDRILRTSSDSPDKIKAVGKTVSVNFQNEAQKSVQDERSVIKRISVRNTGPTCNPETFNKIINYLKSKVVQKYKDLSLEEQHQQALTLAQTFVENEMKLETELNSRTRKLLVEFEKCNV